MPRKRSRKSKQIGPLLGFDFVPWDSSDSLPDPLAGPVLPAPPLDPLHLEDQAAVRAELGIPGDTSLCRFTCRFTRKRDGQRYIYELVGTVEEPTSPPEAPRFTFGPSPGPLPLTIVAWRRRIYCEGTPRFLEALWHPTTPTTTIALHGLEADTTTESPDIESLLYFLKAVETRLGRRPGTRHRSSKAAFHAAYLDAVAKAERRGISPSDEYIARESGLSPSTFYRRVLEHGRPVLPETSSQCPNS